LLETINIYLISACEILCFPSIFISLLQSLSQRLGYFELILLLAKYRVSFIAAIGFKNVIWYTVEEALLALIVKLLAFLLLPLRLLLF